MRIIDNKKDYYDYLAGIYGIDDYITYDRRDSIRLSNDNNDSIILENCYPRFPLIFCPWKNGIHPNIQSNIQRKNNPLLIKYNSMWDDTDRKSKMFPEAYAVNSYLIGILIGFKLYIFTVYRILENERDELVKIVPQLEYIKDYDRSKIKDITAPIIIGELSFDSSFAFTWKYRQNQRDENFFKTAELIIDSEVQSIANRTSIRVQYADSTVINPIMEKTWIPKIIPAQDVWNNISDYLLAIKDKPIVDNRTDVEHAESHGFDKKTSFRNM